MAKKTYQDNPFVNLLSEPGIDVDDAIRHSLYGVADKGHEPEEEEEVLSGKVQYATTKLIVETFKLAKAERELPKEWKSLLKG